jgi:molybdopterin synthase catalytic subunit
MVAIVLPDGATVKDLLQAMGAAHPAWAPLLERSALAVDNDFADNSRILSEGAEIALLPPVSGG